MLYDVKHKHHANLCCTTHRFCQPKTKKETTLNLNLMISGKISLINLYDLKDIDQNIDYKQLILIVSLLS